MFAEATEPVVARRRSLGAEAANRPGQPAIDRDLLDTLVDVVEASDEAEVSVEISGRARHRAPRRAGAAAAATAGGGRRRRRAEDADEGMVRVEQPDGGHVLPPPRRPDQPAFVEVGQRDRGGARPSA